MLRFHESFYHPKPGKCIQHYLVIQKKYLCFHTSQKKSNAVCVLSMMSHDRSITKEEDKKPQIILDYKYNGGVDMMDHLATNYSCRRNTRRWPMTLFFNMLDVGAIASYMMWTTFYPESLPETTAKRKIFLL